MFLWCPGKGYPIPNIVVVVDYSMMGSQPIITLYSKVQFNEGPCPLIQLQYHRARVMPEQPRAGSIQWWCPTTYWMIRQTCSYSDDDGCPCRNFGFLVGRSVDAVLGLPWKGRVRDAGVRSSRCRCSFCSFFGRWSPTCLPKKSKSSMTMVCSSSAMGCQRLAGSHPSVFRFAKSSDQMFRSRGT